jgi:hypothetical protein
MLDTRENLKKITSKAVTEQHFRREWENVRYARLQSKINHVPVNSNSCFSSTRALHTPPNTLTTVSDAETSYAAVCSAVFVYCGGNPHKIFNLYRASRTETRDNMLSGPWWPQQHEWQQQK